MHRLRALAICLILTLIASPAMAAICALQCASGEMAAASQVASQVMDGSMHVAMAVDDGMMHCHDEAASTQGDQNAADNAHATCSMAGCHVAQAASSLQLTLTVFDYTPILGAGMLASQISADLPPPTKPPA